jgi:hypothetical protein
MDIFSHEPLFGFPIGWPGPFFLFDELSQTTAGHCVPFPPPPFSRRVNPANWIGQLDTRVLTGKSLKFQ